MNYTIQNFHVIPGRATLRATADLMICQTVVILDAKLVCGKDKKLFLALPTRKQAERYLPVVQILDPQLRSQIERDLIQRYTARQADAGSDIL